MRTKETLKTVTFYVGLEKTQNIKTYVFTAADFLDNLQIRQEDNNLFYTMIPKDYRKIYLTNNFRINDLVFGSPIGICFEYENGEKEWIKEVSAQSKNAKGLNSMIGYWMQGLTYQEWIGRVDFKGFPMIGRAENSIIVRMGLVEPSAEPEEPYIEIKPAPEPPPKLPEPLPPEPDPTPPPPEPVPLPEFYLVPRQSLIKQPQLANLILRNARHRGPRESNKEFMHQQEFMYDTESIFAALSRIDSVRQEVVEAYYQIDRSTILNTKRKIQNIEERSAIILSSTGSIQSHDAMQLAMQELNQLINTTKEVARTYE